jgi:hypothetical protein
MKVSSFFGCTAIRVSFWFVFMSFPFTRACLKRRVFEECMLQEFGRCISCHLDIGFVR